MSVLSKICMAAVLVAAPGALGAKCEKAEKATTATQVTVGKETLTAVDLAKRMKTAEKHDDKGAVTENWVRQELSQKIVIGADEYMGKVELKQEGQPAQDESWAVVLTEKADGATAEEAVVLVKNTDGKWEPARAAASDFQSVDWDKLITNKEKEVTVGADAAKKEFTVATTQTKQQNAKHAELEVTLETKSVEVTIQKAAAEGSKWTEANGGEILKDVEFADVVGKEKGTKFGANNKFELTAVAEEKDGAEGAKTCSLKFTEKVDKKITYTKQSGDTHWKTEDATFKNDAGIDGLPTENPAEFKNEKNDTAAAVAARTLAATIVQGVHAGEHWCIALKSLESGSKATPFYESLWFLIGLPALIVIAVACFFVFGGKKATDSDDESDLDTSDDEEEDAATTEAKDEEQA